MKLNELSTLRLALLARETREQAAGILRADPIAVVGMACRTPGDCDTPAALWELSRPAPRPMARSRRIGSTRPPGTIRTQPRRASSVTRRGSFLDRVDLFDPDYFGILPREAEQMDPQQRLALRGRRRGDRRCRRAAWPPCGSRDRRLHGLLPQRLRAPRLREGRWLDTRTLTGTVHGVMANRISHFLDLRGPSLTLDTGCSSSLVAIHLACQSLRAGETDLRSAGGVSVMITPELFVAMTKVGFMAPDGRCKTFDASRRRLRPRRGLRRRRSEAAERCGGGRRPRAWRDPRLGRQPGWPFDRAHRAERPGAGGDDPRGADVGGYRSGADRFVEAHGTGTALGDPIEVEAIAAVLGAAKAGAPAASSAPPRRISAISRRRPAWSA